MAVSSVGVELVGDRPKEAVAIPLGPAETEPLAQKPFRKGVTGAKGPTRRRRCGGCYAWQGGGKRCRRGGRRRARRGGVRTVWRGHRDGGRSICRGGRVRDQGRRGGRRRAGRRRTGHRGVRRCGGGRRGGRRRLGRAACSGGRGPGAVALHQVELLQRAGGGRGVAHRGDGRRQRRHDVRGMRDRSRRGPGPRHGAVALGVVVDPATLR